MRAILTMNTIFQRTSSTLKFGFSNILQIMLGDGISRHVFHKRILLGNGNQDNFLICKAIPTND